MTSEKGPRAVLSEAGLRPKKSFGQNFLTDESVALTAARASVPDEEVGRALVVEIGAGTGALTKALLERARAVVAIERDRDLVPLLRRVLAGDIEASRLTIVEADAVTVDLVGLLGLEPPRVLAGNLPYQITGRLLELACHAAESFDRCVFMVQREVANRLLASPSSKEYGALTVFTRAAFDIDRVGAVSRQSFFPAPTVDSTLVRLTPKRERISETPAFRALVRAAFGQRRKTLRNAWSLVAPRDCLERAALAAGVTLDVRGETLNAEQFALAAKAMGS